MILRYSHLCYQFQVFTIRLVFFFSFLVNFQWKTSVFFQGTWKNRASTSTEVCNYCLLFYFKTLPPAQQSSPPPHFVLLQQTWCMQQCFPGVCVSDCQFHFPLWYVCCLWIRLALSNKHWVSCAGSNCEDYERCLRAIPS